MSEPIFKYKDKVKFRARKWPKGYKLAVYDRTKDIAELNDKPEDVVLHGEVYIVDRHGTWEYDIFVPSENMLYKHITESKVERDGD